MRSVPFTRDGHHWSGWPGAVCLKCRAGDPDEEAIADNKWDLGENGEIVWKREEDRLRVEKLTVCPVKGVLKWNPEKGKFYLIKDG